MVPELCLPLMDVDACMNPQFTLQRRMDFSNPLRLDNNVTMEAECPEQPPERHVARVRREQALKGLPALRPPFARSRALGRLGHPRGNWTVARKIGGQKARRLRLHPS